MNTKPMPNTPAPALRVDRVDGGTFVLADQSPERFTMIVMYRGLHCPICETYLETLQGLMDDYAERGVSVIAVSMDDAERARETRDEWDIDRVPLGYGMNEVTARSWGLYMSDAIDEDEPRRFNEPGLFLVRPDGMLHYAAIQSMPFARPALSDVLDAIDFIEDNDYPARGRLAA